MTGYDRPSEKGKPRETITFWAELWRPMAKNSHGESLISPAFGTEPECVGWIRERREDFDQVGMWKRTSRASGEYHDEPLDNDEAPLPNPERLHDLIAQLKAMLEAKKAELDKGPARGKPIERPDNTMDPLKVRMLAYDEVYDEDGKVRPDIHHGWKVTPE